MIVSDVMTTKLVTVEPDDTLSHAANLLRQYQFHHLPVIRASKAAAYGYPSGILDTKQAKRGSLPVLEGVLTSSDIDLAAAVATENSSNGLHRPWQERRVAEVMHAAPITVTPNTSVAAAAQLLVERGLNYLPVVEYDDVEKREQDSKQETPLALVGLLTRSDLLIALARSMGAFEPGMQLQIPLPAGDMTPLARMLVLASELHIQVISVIAAPLEGNVPRVATVRLGTIHPAPLLVRLKEANIQYEFADALPGGNARA